MNSLNLKVRTKLSLTDILINENSPAWVVANRNFNLINNIEIHNFEGTLKIKGTFDTERSYFRESDNRLVIFFTNGIIIKTNENWRSQNPVQYFNIDEDQISIGIEEESKMEDIEDLFNEI